MKPSFIDHLSIIVSDIGKTAEFYGKFLGEPIKINEEKVVYQIGDTKIFFRLPYSEWRERDKDQSGLNHIGFGVKDVDELKKFENILNENHIENSGVKISKLGTEFVWFDDPNGYRLEFYVRLNREEIK